MFVTLHVQQQVQKNTDLSILDKGVANYGLESMFSATQAQYLIGTLLMNL